MPQLEQFELLPPPDAAPAEWQQYEVPVGYERAGDVIPIRRAGKVVEIEFGGGEILRATRQSRDRMFVRLGDGKRIHEHGFDKFMSKIALAREDRLARARSEQAEERERELRERAEKAAQEAAEAREHERALAERMASLLEEKPGQAVKARCRNKLAAKRAPQPANFQPRFINPKPLIGKDPDSWFAPRFAWLKNVPGMTGAEQDAYAWMAFRASDDGVFRGSLRRLAEDVNCSQRHLLVKVIPSLLARNLVVREDRGAGKPAWFRFVDPEQLGWRSKIITPGGDLCSPDLVISVPKTGDLCSPHKERREKQQERLIAPDGEEQLLAEIGSLLGDVEMKKNGAGWRIRMRGGPRETRALRNTIEDFKNRASNKGNPIRHPAKWFTDKYLRNLVEIDKAAGANASVLNS